MFLEYFIKLHKIHYYNKYVLLHIKKNFG